MSCNNVGHLSSEGNGPDQECLEDRKTSEEAFHTVFVWQTVEYGLMSILLKFYLVNYWNSPKGAEIRDGRRGRVKQFTGHRGNRQNKLPPLSDLDLQSVGEPESSLCNIKKPKGRWILLSLTYERVLIKLPYCGLLFQLLFWTTLYHVEEDTSIIANFYIFMEVTAKKLFTTENIFKIEELLLGLWAQSASIGCSCT